nr:immunoglobulin light chain junction region [Macaca mulatta]MOV73006.1 immunoglobulin light chain junction region [Macaca mulatta]MOV73572.1 immunoglobulin light chain junction region [Macaca mulatta]MOV73842.1 immunoglobulin light chain junction region [Macaca mulatta]MOV74028.1 immunoglobulin light chain junction region [Macaca mulatta]
DYYCYSTRGSGYHGLF